MQYPFAIREETFFYFPLLFSVNNAIMDVISRTPRMEIGSEGLYSGNQILVMCCCRHNNKPHDLQIPITDS